jgi:hypothetical protein
VKEDIPVKAYPLLLLSAALFLSSLAGCSDRPAPGPKEAGPRAAEGEEAEVQAALAKLPPEDRKLAEAQKYCAVESENRLGSMAVPFKVMVKGQPVFLCCKGCRKQALADPDRTLARVEKLKARAAEAPQK